MSSLFPFFSSQKKHAYKITSPTSIVRYPWTVRSDSVLLLCRFVCVCYTFDRETKVLPFEWYKFSHLCQCYCSISSWLHETSPSALKYLIFHVGHCRPSFLFPCSRDYTGSATLFRASRVTHFQYLRSQQKIRRFIHQYICHFLSLLFRLFFRFHGAFTFHLFLLSFYFKKLYISLSLNPLEYGFWVSSFRKSLSLSETKL